MYEKIGEDQIETLVGIFKKRLIDQNFSKLEANTIIKSNNFSDELSKILKKSAIFDENFGLPIIEFETSFDEGEYNIKNFIENYQGKSYQDVKIEFNNFGKNKTSKHVIEYGKKYIIKIFPILNPRSLVQPTTSVHKCIDFLKKHNSVFLGNQGIIHFYKKIEHEVSLKFKLPYDKRVISFFADDFSKNNDNFTVSTVIYYPRFCDPYWGARTGSLEFSEKTIKDVSNDSSCLLCISNK